MASQLRREHSTNCCSIQNLKGQMLISLSLTPCSRDLLEKLTALQLVKKFPAFYGTQRFMTALHSIAGRNSSST
jgi:hypothetical protein